MDAIKYVLLDIEGTICPISFVKDTLFPYAIKALPDVLAAKWDDPDFLPYREAFPPGLGDSQVALLAHVEDLTKRDVKVAYLKNLQGYLWEEGYESGAYATPLFPDVAPQLKRWRAAGLELAIYSSGSVFAQKLLFAHVDVRVLPLSKKHARPDDEKTADEVALEHAGPAIKRTKVSGDKAHDQLAKPDVVAATVREHVKASVHQNEVEDLTELFGGWFDTTNAGPKTDSTSYNKILAAMNWQPSRTLFLSDNAQEINAAAIASIHAILVERPGNAPVAEFERQRLEAIGSLEELRLPDAKGERKAAGGEHAEIDADAIEPTSGDTDAFTGDGSGLTFLESSKTEKKEEEKKKEEVGKKEKIVTASDESPIQRLS